ncbi:MAG: hypothetical protein AAF570_26280, partial [Bacteroidota bacterium]
REFWKYGAEHFTGQKEYETAIGLLRKLLERGYKKGRLKYLTVRIGQELATRDHEMDPNGNSKTKALRYTNGEKGLKHLYKAYVKQWKKL